LPTEDYGGPVIITKYIPNGSLGDINNRRYRHEPMPGGFGLVNMAAIFYGVAQAMAYFHSHQVVHRDLKPDNILLDENYRPFVADFGLVRVAPAPTEGGEPCPPLLMSPEIRDSADLKFTGVGDVYAFGMTLYLSFSDASLPSFEDGPPVKNYRDVAARIAKGYKFAKPQLMPDLYWRLTEAALAKSPDDRPTFRQICERMASPEYALEDDKADIYMEYVIGFGGK
jgi:serine/threonine protein kinase